MKDRHQFQSLSPHSVWNEVRCPRHNQFTRSGHPARPSHSGLCLKQIDSLENPARNQRRILLGILSDVRSEGDQMADRTAGPDDLQLGTVVSPGLPQEFSQFDTLSWLTSCPASSSTSAVRTAAACTTGDRQLPPSVRGQAAGRLHQSSRRRAYPVGAHRCGGGECWHRGVFYVYLQRAFA